MSQKSIRLLAAIVAGLVLLMLALQNGNQDSSSSRQTQLLPGLATRANDATDIRVRLPAADATVAIRRGADGWEVTSSNNYAADVAKLQPLIMALSRALQIFPTRSFWAIPRRAITAMREYPASRPAT